MARDRVQKVLARAGVTSRRGAEELIAAGRVAVNGATVELGATADPQLDHIEIDGRPIPDAATATYLALHKPPGYVSSARDERDLRSVLALVPRFDGRLWPAGRLDVGSEGLMVLTNDGDWANRVLHPRYGTLREYAVLVDRAPSRDEVRALLRGVELDDGGARLRSVRPAHPPREVARDPAERGVWLRVEIGEGRKREVRRIFDALGIDVIRLVRVRLGPLTIRGLRSGEWRELSPAEIAAMVGQPQPSSRARPYPSRSR